MIWHMRIDQNQINRLNRLFVVPNQVTRGILPLYKVQFEPPECRISNELEYTIAVKRRSQIARSVHTSKIDAKPDDRLCHFRPHSYQRYISA